MKLVVDTNIVFSALLNPESTVGLVLSDFSNQYEFYAPELIETEIVRYWDKIKKYSKLEDTQLAVIKNYIFNSITIISEDLISPKSWEKAFELTNKIDENDTPFIALALELQTKLWTGDKKILEGISEFTISTNDLSN